MISVLGLPLDDAVARLKKNGCVVELIETRSIKGVQAPDSLRVIRQIECAECDIPIVRLVYSAFQTSVYSGPDEDCSSSSSIQYV